MEFAPKGDAVETAGAASVTGGSDGVSAVARTGGGRGFAAANWRLARSAARLSTQLRDHFFERREALRVHELQQSEFEVQARIGLAPQVVIGREQDIEKARQVFFAEFCGLLGQARTFVGGRGDQIRIGAADARHEQIAEMANRLRGRNAADFARRR